jgi:ABC-type transport system substrate-binding protein
MARRDANPASRAQEYAQAEQKILDDVAVIPTFWPTVHTLVKSCVKGYPDTATDIAKWRYVDIDNTK